MKTKISTLVALFFTLFMLASTVSKAQCGTIDNQTACSITVNIRLFGLPNCKLCNEVDAVIPAGTSYAIPCGSCPALCNVRVRVTRVGTTPLTGVGTDWTLPPSSYMGCGSGTSTITYNSSTNTFVVN
jgi:hypothetical protein